MSECCEIQQKLKKPLCPECKKPGKAVETITTSSLILESELWRLQKETEEPIPICYCFNYTRQMVLAEMLQAGKTAIPDRIRAEVKAGNCSCETTNPQGSCCLGNVSRTVKWAENQLKIK